MWADCPTVLYLLFFTHTESGSAGSAHDIQIFEHLHMVNQEPHRIPLLCLSPTQVHEKDVDIAKERNTQGYTVKGVLFYRFNGRVTLTACQPVLYGTDLQKRQSNLYGRYIKANR